MSSLGTPFMNVHLKGQGSFRSNLNLLWISLLLFCDSTAAQTPQNWVHSYKYPELSAGQVNGLLLSQDSTVWVFNGNGVYEIKNHRTRPTKISSLNISDPVSDRQGILYYYRGNMVCSISEAEIKSLPDSLEHPNCFKLEIKHMEKPSVKERAGNSILITCVGVEPTGDRIWIGTKKSGLFSLSKLYRRHQSWATEKPRHYYKIVARGDTNNVLLDNTVTRLFCDKENGAWVGFENGLMRFDLASPRTVIWDMNIFCIMERSKEGQIWVVGMKKSPHMNHLAIFSYDDKSYSSSPALSPAPLWPAAIREDLLRDIHIDDAGDFWLAGDLLYRARKYGKIESFAAMADRMEAKGEVPDLFSGSEGFDSSYPSHFVQDKESIIWVGTGDKGLFYVKKTPGIHIAMEQMIKCHDDRTGHLVIKAVEGKPPYYLFWKSRNNKDGDAKTFPASLTNLVADTFEFWLIDKIKTDTGYMKYTLLENPQPVKAKIVEKIPPTFEDDCDGKITIEASGGRVNMKSGRRKDEYDYKWSNGKDAGQKTNWNLEMGVFSVTITDTLKCQTVVSGTFTYSTYFSKAAWNCAFAVKDRFEVPYIGFDTSSAKIKPEYRPVLANIGAWMQRYPSLRIEIGGHVHKGCKDKNCISLSEKRALNTKDILVKEHGISSDRIQTKGYGDSKSAGNKKDLRVDITVIGFDSLEIKKKCDDKLVKKRPCRH